MGLASPCPDVGIEQFLRALFPDDAPGNIGVCGSDFLVSWHTSAAEIAEAFTGKTNAYFHCCKHDPARITELNSLDAKPSARPRGRVGSATYVPGAWLDIDIQCPGRDERKKIPPDFRSARALLDEAFPLPPSIVVNSGGGLHAYYLLKEGCEIGSEVERVRIAQWTHAMEETVLSVARSRGWSDMERVSDLARVLRLPQTKNVKRMRSVQDVKVVEWRPGTRYTEDDFSEYLVKTSAAPAVRGASIATDQDFTDDNGRFKPGNLYQVLSGCDWMQKGVFEGSATLSEPEWYAAASIVGRCENGEEQWHRLSQGHPGYKRSEAAEKLRHALNSAGPRSCAWIAEATANRHCRDCRFHQLIKTPLQLGRLEDTGERVAIIGESSENAEDRRRIILTKLSSLFSLPEIREVILRGSQEPDLEMHFADGRVACLGTVEDAMSSRHVDGRLTACLLRVTWTGGGTKQPNVYWQKEGLDHLVGVARRVETWTQEEETLEWVQSFAVNAEDAGSWDAERKYDIYRGEASFVSSASKAWLEDGRLHFRPSDFMSWLQVYLRQNISSPELAKRLSRVGFTRERLSVQSRTLGLWANTRAWVRSWPPDSGQPDVPLPSTPQVPQIER